MGLLGTKKKSRTRSKTTKMLFLRTTPSRRDKKRKERKEVGELDEYTEGEVGVKDKKKESHASKGGVINGA